MIILVLAPCGWFALYRIFRSEGLISRWNAWFGLMGFGAILAGGAALAKLISDDRGVDSWAGWALIVGLSIEVAPLILGGIVGGRRRRP